MPPAAPQIHRSESQTARLLADILLGVLPALLLLALGLFSLTWLLEDWPLYWPAQLVVMALLLLGVAAGVCLVVLIFKPRPLQPGDAFVSWGRVLLPIGALLAVIPGFAGAAFLSSVNERSYQALLLAEALSSLLAIVTALRYLSVLRHLGGGT